MEGYNNKIPLVAVVGPTASGKTGFAIEIAKNFNGEIVSLDSMQIYKYLNIGTAKPSIEEMSGIPHHMIDCIEPNTPFSASDYATEASNIIKDIYSRGKLPILCGGTGLYFDAVLYGFNMSEASYDNDLREKLYKQAEENGVMSIYECLQEVDPKSAEEIHPNNLKRVVRALEIYILTGKPKSEQITSEKEYMYDVVILGMDWQRDILYDRINKRVDIMIKNGLEKEVRELLYNGILTQNSQAYQAIGYKEMIAYINGEYTFENAVELIKMYSRRYAKRQLTWFNKNKSIIWLNPNNTIVKEAAHIKIKNLIERHSLL